MKRNLSFLFLVLIIVFSFSIGISSASIGLSDIPSNITISDGDDGAMQPNFPLTLDKTMADDGSYEYEYRVLNSFVMRKIHCTTNESNFVYLGGKPLGISVGNSGVIVTGFTDIITIDGNKSPARGIIEIGDTIISIDGISIEKSTDISKALLSKKDNYQLKILRDGKELMIQITPATDCINQQHRIGLILKEVVSGIGTLTYVNPKNLRYGALGHPIIDGETGNNLDKASGLIYNAKIFGAIKGIKGKAGELTGTFYADSPTIGTIDRNNAFGIFGKYSESLEGLQKIEIGNKAQVQPGKAYIYTTVNDGAVEKYEIEIIRTFSQSQAKSKGMVLRVTDKRLLQQTGGIVQGMSGSPIIQNDKIIGAVTHVFLSDPTKGYGMYIDWMLSN